MFIQTVADVKAVEPYCLVSQHNVSYASGPFRPPWKMLRESGQILADIVLRPVNALKTSSVEGNPLLQGLYEGMLQIEFQGGHSASSSVKDCKASLCVSFVHGCVKRCKL